VISTRRGAVGERQRAQFGAIHRQIAGDHSVGPQQRCDERPCFGRARFVYRWIAATDIDMRQRDFAGQPRARLRQHLAQIAEQQPLGRRDASRMRADLALTDIDVTRWEQLAQMVVAAPIAEPQF